MEPRYDLEMPCGHVHTITVVFRSADAHQDEDGREHGEGLVVTVQGRGCCWQCAQWVRALFPLLQASHRACQDELRRRQREISYLRDIMDSSRQVTALIRDMHDDAEAERHKAEDELVRRKLECDCEWRRGLRAAPS